MAKPVVFQILGGDTSGINARLDQIFNRLGVIMATVEEVVAAVGVVKANVETLVAALTPLPAAIDALEAAVTAAGLTQAQKDALAAALADLNKVGSDVGAAAASVSAAVADATDNIDEGAGTGGGPV